MIACFGEEVFESVLAGEMKRADGDESCLVFSLGIFKYRAERPDPIKTPFLEESVIERLEARDLLSHLSRNCNQLTSVRRPPSFDEPLELRDCIIEPGKRISKHRVLRRRRKRIH